MDAFGGRSFMWNTIRNYISAEMGPRLDYKILVVEENNIPTVCY